MSEAEVAPPVAAPVVAPEAPPAEAAKPELTESAPVPPEGEVKPETADQPEKRNTHRFERKINKLYREAAEQKARADLLERQLTESRPKPQNNDAPKLEDFEFDTEKHSDALADYKLKAKEREREAQRTEQNGKAAREKLTADWEAQTVKAESKHDDFYETVGDLTPDTPIAAAVMLTDNGADVAYFLGKDTKEARRIASLDPMRQMIEVGKLSAKLALQPQAERKLSEAPAPIKPLKGSSPPSSKALNEINDYDEFVKKREAQIAARR